MMADRGEAAKVTAAAAAAATAGCIATGSSGNGAASAAASASSSIISSSSIVPVVVVESHAHALEHVHAALRHEKRRQHRHRHRRRPNHNTSSPDDHRTRSVDPSPADTASVAAAGSSWSMLHFDAHPDLACPGGDVPARACFRPTGDDDGGDDDDSDDDCEDDDVDNNNKSEKKKKKKNLYELLDSTASGMAEWILPLAVAAELRRVEWVRPPPSCCSFEDDDERATTSDNNHSDCQDVTTFPLGEHEYTVGVWIPPAAAPSSSATAATDNEQRPHRCDEIRSYLDLPAAARVRVDWDCPYYCDDDDDDGAFSSFAPLNELQLPQTLSLSVYDLSSTPPLPFASSSPPPPSTAASLNSKKKTPRNDEPWMLDICLDYFACLNPFLTDLEAVDADFARALRRVVLESDFYRNHYANSGSNDNNDNNEQSRSDEKVPAGATSTEGNDDQTRRRRRLACFRRELAQLLNSLRTKQEEERSNVLDVLQSLSNYYTPRQKGIDLLHHLVGSLKRYREQEPSLEPSQQTACVAAEGRGNNNSNSNSNNRADKHADLSKSQNDAEKVKVRRLVDDAVQALPFLLLPHHPLPARATAAASAAIEDRLQAVRGLLLARRKEDHGGIPFLVTIARSAREGFTPPWWVEELQTKVLDLLHECYCSSSGGGGDGDGCSSYRNGAATTTSTVESCTKKRKLTVDKQQQLDDDRRCRLNVVLDYGQWEGSVIEYE